MPGLHIDKIGGTSNAPTTENKTEDSYFKAPVTDINVLEAISTTEIAEGQRRFVKNQKADYYYDPEALAGDIAPLDQIRGKGYWIKVVSGNETFVEAPTLDQENKNKIYKLHESLLVDNKPETIAQHISNLDPPISIGEKENLYIDLLSEETAKPFITTWNVYQAATIKLPTSFYSPGDLDITVDWGDGSPLQKINKAIGAEDQLNHTYAPGTYTMTIYGVISYWNFQNSWDSRLYITGVVQWGDNPFRVCKFNSCTYFSSLPQNEVPNFHAVEDMSYAYSRTGVFNIPANLFQNAENVTNYDGTFSATYIGSIPEPLFWNSPLAETFSGTFSECRNLATKVPKNLFKYNGKATVFRFTFRYCPFTEVEGELFYYNPLVVDFGYCFEQSGLTVLPGNLFQKNTLVKKFDQTFASAKLTAVPHGIFHTCTIVETFEYTFARNQITTIPLALFDYTTEVINFRSTFESNLIEEVNEDLFFKATKAENFQLVLSKNKITSVPALLFSKNVLATDFFGVLQQNELSTVPVDLFATNVLATTMGWAFAINKLTSVPGALFSTNTLVTDFGFVFDKNLLTTVPVELFANNALVVSFSGALSENKLVDVPLAIFANNPLAVQFGSTFSHNPDWITEAVPVWNIPGATGASCYYNTANVSNYEEIPANFR